MRRVLAALLSGFLLVLGTVVGVAPAATAAKPPWHGSYIQVTKVTNTTVTARIRCPQDPDPGGTQFFSLYAITVDGAVTVSYRADVAALCDMRRHHVTLARFGGNGDLAAGDRVNVYGTISGDSGEVNVWYENWKVQR
jgi:hypothetical protein